MSDTPQKKVFTQEDFQRWGSKGGKAGSRESKIKAIRTRWDRVKQQQDKQEEQPTEKEK